MNVRWTQDALRDLESICSFVFGDNPEAATVQVRKIYESIQALGKHAYIGRKGRVAGTRELAVPPYVVIYRIRRAAVEIGSILRSARRWPNSL